MTPRTGRSRPTCRGFGPGGRTEAFPRWASNFSGLFHRSKKTSWVISSAGGSLRRMRRARACTAPPWRRYTSARACSCQRPTATTRLASLACSTSAITKLYSERAVDPDEERSRSISSTWPGTTADHRPRGARRGRVHLGTSAERWVMIDSNPHPTHHTSPPGAPTSHRAHDVLVVILFGAAPVPARSGSGTAPRSNPVSTRRRRPAPARFTFIPSASGDE